MGECKRFFLRVFNVKFLICIFLLISLFGCTQNTVESEPSIRYEKNQVDLKDGKTTYVYDMDITLTMNGKEKVYSGNIQVNDGSFTMDESSLTSKGSKTCTVNNFAPDAEDIENVYKVKEIRCNGGEDKYYLWIKDEKLFVEKEYDNDFLKE